ncbi:ribosomal RNA processing protein 1 homolog [Maniola hyperantus]|uniref:ribosomal RNA processing protein 1 homolog n=1 Tax=Aphantopus hyperantus TaxID=2795564 RepID=UPI001568B28D|nr:ribosomal RNA processing protein 1 homolog [Maniola hyperantus]
MKLPDKKNPKKQKTKMKTITKPKKEKVFLVAQEFKFARLLSGNEKRTRDRVLKTLKKWLSNCFEKKYEFKEDDFIRVWKGLFYAVWMSDKPLVQEDLCESIAATLDLFPPDQIEYAIMMIKAGFKVLATEWYGIDQHRMDKFLMLVRRYLRGSFRCLQRCEWKLTSCQMFADMLCSSDGILALKTPLYARNAASLMLHVTDCYLEELSKVSKGEIPDESLVALLYPISVQVCGGEGTLAMSCRSVLTNLIKQSELGLEYDIATSAWNKLGCPAGGPEALERVSDDDSDDDDDDVGSEQADESLKNGKQNNGPEPLDPRAGRVDVTLEPLPVPARMVAEQLRILMATASSKAYKRAKICLERFEELSRNQYPLRVPAGEAAGPEPRPQRAEPKRAATRLRALEKLLVKQSDELALRGLSRKHRKRLLAKSRSGVNIVDELLSSGSIPADSTNGAWHVETTATEDKNKQSESNKENKAVDKKKNRKRKLQEKASQEQSKKPKVDRNNKSKQLETKKNKVKDKKVIKNSNENKQNLKIESGKKENKNKIVMIKNNKISNSDKGKDNKLSDGSNKVKDTISKEKKKTIQDKVVNIKTNKPTNDITNKPIVKKQKGLNAKHVNKNFNPQLYVNKVKYYQKRVNAIMKKDGTPKKKVNMETPKKVKFVLKNNSMQETVDYYKSVRQSPNIPFDSSKLPTKTNLKPSTPSPINPFFKKKLKLKKF